MHESAVRGAHLVNQLLTLTRAEPEAAGTLPLQRVDLAALAAEVASDHVPRALQAGIDLGVEDAAGRGGTPVAVLGNEALLREAVVNLVDNAIRYAGRGAEVTLSVRRDGAMAVLEVADNGPGVAPDQHGGRLRPLLPRHARGQRLRPGLAIVREIATRHGGRAVALPAVPQGLRVQLWLPHRHKD